MKSGTKGERNPIAAAAHPEVFLVNRNPITRRFRVDLEI